MGDSKLPSREIIRMTDQQISLPDEGECLGVLDILLSLSASLKRNLHVQYFFAYTFKS